MAGLAYWNDWLNGLYYINDEKMFTMQNILNRMLKDAQFLATGAASNVGDLIRDTPLNGMKMAVAVVGVVPILIIYPFIQKYLVQGDYNWGCKRIKLDKYTYAWIKKQNALINKNSLK